LSHRRSKLERKILAEAQEIAAPHGIEIFLEIGGRHPKLILVGNGTRRIEPLPSSPRNPDDAIVSTRQDIRRLCREICAA